MSDKIVMYDSEEAAKPATVTGWVNHKGFFHTDERIVRYDGCTHKVCECGKIVEKKYTICEECRLNKSIARYEKMPFKEWDGNTPLVIHDDDQYFFDEDDLTIYCEDNDCKPEDLRLVICDPNYLSQIDGSQWSDDLPYDGDGELPPKIEELLKQLNKAIQEEGPVSWGAGKYRTSYKPVVPNQ